MKRILIPLAALAFSACASAPEPAPVDLGPPSQERWEAGQAAYLSWSGARRGWTTTESGLQYRREGRASRDGAIRIVDHDDPAFEARTAFLPNNHGPVVAAGLTGADLTLAALFRLPRLYATTYREGWRTWAAANRLDLPPPTAEREFGHNHSLIEAAAAGLGAAVIPWSFGAPDIESGRLVAPFGFISRPASFVFLRPPGRADPAMDAFQDWLIAEGAATPSPPDPIRPA